MSSKERVSRCDEVSMNWEIEGQTNKKCADFHICCSFLNKTIKDGDIAPWKDLRKEKRKRNQIRPYFEMGRIVEC